LEELEEHLGVVRIAVYGGVTKDRRNPPGWNSLLSELQLKLSFEVLANLKICRSIVIPGKRSATRNPDFSGCPGFPLKFTLAKAGAGMTVFRTFARAS
ncbi:MAG: hypothetical protein QME78_14180, partial [Thermodesulfobacteriota bacterium]|nr:hypothetical protein [Thermodesulfobacteriota bacterium]